MDGARGRIVKNVLQKQNWRGKIQNMTLTQELQTAMVRVSPSLIMSEKREEDLLQKAGFVHHLETNKTKRKELELLKKFGQFITYEEIKTVGMRYNMGFVHVGAFTGTPGPNTANRIDQFERKYGALKGDRFFVLAPVEMINVPAPVVMDPVLFYRIGKDRFFLIDQWGGDMTWTRRLQVALCRESMLGPALLAGLCMSAICAPALSAAIHSAAAVAVVWPTVAAALVAWYKLCKGAATPLRDWEFDRLYAGLRI